MVEIEMVGVREYGERFPVFITRDTERNRICIKALNEGGYNYVKIDLADILDWMDKNYCGDVD